MVTDFGIPKTKATIYLNLFRKYTFAIKYKFLNYISDRLRATPVSDREGGLFAAPLVSRYLTG